MAIVTVTKEEDLARVALGDVIDFQIPGAAEIGTEEPAKSGLLKKVITLADEESRLHELHNEALLRDALAARKLELEDALKAAKAAQAAAAAKAAKEKAAREKAEKEKAEKEKAEKEKAEKEKAEKGKPTDAAGWGARPSN